ncbi:MAG: PIG-L family deacetylase, partial [Acidimicrobiia bacterium]|nr:PIG-L family deacetylase [Acidimicrobiia bacterium]
MRRGLKRRARLVGLAAALLVVGLPTTGVVATDVPSGGVLVFVAHPDDDVLMAAGVIKQAVEAGNPVTVAYMTNGDRCATPSQVPAGHCDEHLPGIGDTRQDEAVEALEEVFGGSFPTGFDEDDMIFLGYPGGFLPYVRNGTPPLPGDMPNTATYADRGLGRTDWHDYWDGGHAPYTASAMSEDVFELIERYRPDHIFTHSEFDRHSDHLTTYRELMEAIDEVQDIDPSYDPLIHTGIVHVAAPAVPLSWPDPQLDPTDWHVPVPELEVTSEGELLWENRESFEVPAAMQNPWASNPKAQSVEAHASQVDNWLRRFVKRDEVFWIERLGNARGINDAYTVAEGGTLNIDPG